MNDCPIFIYHGDTANRRLFFVLKICLYTCFTIIIEGIFVWCEFVSCIPRTLPIVVGKFINAPRIFTTNRKDLSDLPILTTAQYLNGSVAIDNIANINNRIVFNDLDHLSFIRSWVFGHIEAKIFVVSEGFDMVNPNIHIGFCWVCHETCFRNRLWFFAVVVRMCLKGYRIILCPLTVRRLKHLFKRIFDLGFNSLVNLQEIF